jgi:hypothetical protein
MRKIAERRIRLYRPHPTLHHVPNHDPSELRGIVPMLIVETDASPEIALSEDNSADQWRLHPKAVSSGDRQHIAARTNWFRQARTITSGENDCVSVLICRVGFHGSGRTRLQFGSG